MRNDKEVHANGMLNDNFFPLVRGTPSFAFMFTPATLTVNAQSVTVG
jgi:hypothetical protein